MSENVDKVVRLTQKIDHDGLLHLNLSPDLLVSRVRIAQWNSDYWPDAMSFVMIDMNTMGGKTTYDVDWLRKKYRKHVVSESDWSLGTNSCDFYFERPIKLYDNELFIGGRYSEITNFENAALHVYGTIIESKKSVIWEFDVVGKR
jgi:hypothetical protein